MPPFLFCGQQSSFSTASVPLCFWPVSLPLLSAHCLRLVFRVRCSLLAALNAQCPLCLVPTVAQYAHSVPTVLSARPLSRQIERAAAGRRLGAAGAPTTNRRPKSICAEVRPHAFWALSGRTLGQQRLRLANIGPAEHWAQRTLAPTVARGARVSRPQTSLHSEPTVSP